MADIRRATEVDRAGLLALARAMHAESPRYNMLQFSEPRTMAMIETMIGHEDGCALVAEADGQLVAMMAGFVAPHFFSEARIATDVALFILPAHRGGSLAVRLVRGFEGWAKSRGAAEIALGVSTELASERTAQFYERLGYRRSGHSLLKQGI